MNEQFEGLGLVELIDLLEPVPEPAAISMWPQTWGWVWLGLILLALIGFAIWRWVLHRRRNAYRRAARREVAAARGEPGALAAIVRRAALAGYARADVAGLWGEAWLAFLDASYGGDGFSRGPGRGLATAPYSKGGETDDLTPLVMEWLKRHRVPR